MLVYRYTTEEELKHVIEGNKHLIGDYDDEITRWSSHNTHKSQVLTFFQAEKSY
ncbi:MAG: hypothetical protein IJW24_01140 [Clostridia bacterium]|nr:hypothetical protein [Clostridia bacterium]